MKKLLLFLSIVAAGVLAFTYFFTPTTVHFKNFMYVNTSTNNATRFLLDEKGWHKWWPADAGNKTDSLFNYKNVEYAVNWKMTMGDSVIIKNNGERINSLINIIPINRDTTAFQWEGESAPEKNLFKKWGNYFKQKQMQANADDIFKALRNFLENKENLYGLKIEHSMVKDTLLISSKKEFTHYPATAEIYELINGLKNYIAKNGVTETNNPMLHIVQDSGRFKTMVAIPISKAIPNTDNFIIKKMVAGKILIAQTKGGAATAEDAIKKLEIYMDDYHILSPAISFQSLVTDRSKEADSTKWVTKIYYPIM